MRRHGWKILQIRQIFGPPAGSLVGNQFGQIDEIDRQATA
jgi:hypothetical protein